MIFTTYPFLVFFAAVLLGVRLSERWPSAQRVFLLAASYFFYGYWDWRFLTLIWISTFLDYYVGRALERSDAAGHRKRLLALSVVGNLGMLGVFKYYDFFAASTAKLLTMMGIPFQPALLELILPVGISFYTFQTMSYTIDVFRKKIPACHNPLQFALFVCYFPQLVAGPIERAGHLLPQLEQPREIRWEPLLSGLLLIIWGTFKKAIVADMAGQQLVDPLFGSPRDSIDLWIGVLAFGLQIYGDFSGYCDIARGASRALGIELIENFDAPYVATSITDFWRRWHISLSTWFRDYLYISLGGNRCGAARTYLNLAATMFLCGLWHGAGLNFVVWGLWHGALLLLHRMWVLRRDTDAPPPSLLHRIGGWVLTFWFVHLGWFLFREADFGLVLSRFPGLLWPVPTLSFAAYSGKILLFLTLCVPIAVAHWVQIRQNTLHERIEQLPWMRPALLGLLAALLIVMIALLGTLNERLPFIYFQF